MADSRFSSGISSHTFQSITQLSDAWARGSLRDYNRAHKGGKGLLTKVEIAELRGKVKWALGNVDPDELRKVFQTYDVHRNGFLTTLQFIEACKRNLAPEHPLNEAVHLLAEGMVTIHEFRRCLGVITCQNEDGYVDYEELITYVAGPSKFRPGISPKRRPRLTAEELEEFRNGLSIAAMEVHGHDLRSLFLKYDTDKNGVLSANEFMQVVMSVAPHLASDHKLNEIMMYLDKDGSETIDLEEWFAFMEPAVGVQYKVRSDSHKVKARSPTNHKDMNVESRVRQHLFMRKRGPSTATPKKALAKSPAAKEALAAAAGLGQGAGVLAVAAAADRISDESLAYLKHKMAHRLRAAARSSDLRKLFKAYDLNNDNTIDLPEFTKICARCCPMTPREIRSVFGCLETSPGTGFDFDTFAAFVGI